MCPNRWGVGWKGIGRKVWQQGRTPVSKPGLSYLAMHGVCGQRWPGGLWVMGMPTSNLAAKRDWNWKKWAFKQASKQWYIRWVGVLSIWWMLLLHLTGCGTLDPVDRRMQPVIGVVLIMPIVCRLDDDRPVLSTNNWYLFWWRYISWCIYYGNMLHF